MIVEFDKSFEKWLSKICEPYLLSRIEQIIFKAEGAETI